MFVIGGSEINEKIRNDDDQRFLSFTLIVLRFALKPGVIRTGGSKSTSWHRIWE